MMRVSMSSDVRPVDGGLQPHPAYQIAPGTAAWPDKNCGIRNYFRKVSLGLMNKIF